MKASITLKNGLNIPRVGFGTYRIKDNDSVEKVVSDAFAAGYRLFDSAAYYGNETQLKEAFRSLGIRDEILVTSKVWNDTKTYDEALKGFEDSERNLGEVDIYMLHWPAAEFVERWKALEDVYKAGRVKAIGVSNFKKHHLETLKAHATIMPMINQIEAHAYFMDMETISYCQQNEIVVQAWRPLMRTGDMLNNKDIAKIAEKYGKTTAQVCLRYLLQMNICIIPKSVKPERMHENIDVYDFVLSEEDMEFMRSLNVGMRTSDDPDTFILPE